MSEKFTDETDVILWLAEKLGEERAMAERREDDAKAEILQLRQQINGDPDGWRAALADHRATIAQLQATIAQLHHENEKLREQSGPTTAHELDAEFHAYTPAQRLEQLQGDLTEQIRRANEAEAELERVTSGHDQMRSQLRKAFDEERRAMQGRIGHLELRVDDLKGDLGVATGWHHRLNVAIRQLVEVFDVGPATAVMAPHGHAHSNATGDRTLHVPFTERECGICAALTRRAGDLLPGATLPADYPEPSEGTDTR